MKNPVKISMFALLFAIIALPVIAQQGGATATPIHTSSAFQTKANVKVTPDFEKKLWCEVVHRNYSSRNDELNALNDSARDRAIDRIYESGFKLKSTTIATTAYGDNYQVVTQTNYFFERANLR